MAQFKASGTKSVGLALLGTGLLATGASIGGCSRNNANVETAAIAIEQATPTARPKPTATPGPTPRPKKPGIALYKVETKQKVFALTFDDGPDPTYTPQVLKILKQKNAPATFFMVGTMVRAWAPTGKKVVQDGHSIGGHSWTHPMKTHSPVMEIERTDAMIKEKLGVTPTMFRPPYGMLKNGLAREASKRNEDVILWSADSNDWNRHTTSAQIKAKVLNNLTPGGIALLHDGGGNRTRTVAALPGIIDGIRNRGYKLVTVPELLNMGKPDLAHIDGVAASKVGKKHAKQAAKTAKKP